MSAITRVGLAALVVGYLALSWLFHAATPPLEASDEAAHLGFALYVKDQASLPVADRQRPTLAHQEAIQAPLYYVVCAALIRSIDTSNAIEFYARRPDTQIGRADAPGPKHVFLGHGDRSWPYQRTMRAVGILRLTSMLLGLVTVVFTYRIGILVAPETPAVGLLGGALVAFNPMFLFISNSVNNDNLTMAMMAGALWGLVRHAHRVHPAALGGVSGAMVLTKVSGGIVIPAALYDLWVRKLSWTAMGRQATLFAGAFLLTAGWWFARNLQLYGEFLALTEHVAMSGNDRAGVDLLALLREWEGFLKSYWGVFGAFNVVYPEWIYLGFFAITGLLTGSLGWWCVRDGGKARSRVVPLVIVAGANLLAVVYWTSQLFGSQGRLMFPSIAALAVLGAQGLHAWGDRSRPILEWTIVMFLIATATYGAVTVIPAAYP